MNVPVNAADQARQASQTGDVLKPKLDEQYEQQASLVPHLIKAFRHLTNPDTTRVLTPREQRTRPGQNYQAQQQKAASELGDKGLLSEKGQAEFREREGRIRQEETEARDIQKRASLALTREKMGHAPSETAPKSMAPEWKPPEILSAKDRAKRAIDTSDDAVDEFGFAVRDFNFEYIESSDDIKALIAAVSEVDEAATETAKRGERTNVVTRAEAERLLADDMGETGRILRRRVGETWNAEQMVAARKIMARSASRLNELAKEIEEMHAGGNIQTALLLRFRRQLALHSGIQMQVKGAQTEIARALQSFQIPVGVEMEPDILADMLQGSGGPGLAIDMAKTYAKMYKEGGVAGASKFANNAWWVKTNRMWQSVYMNGLLSHTTTQWKNFFSAPTFMFYKLGEEFVAGVLGTAERGIRRYRGLPADPNGVYLSDFLFRAYGNARNVRNAWSVAYDAFKTNKASDYLSKLESYDFDPFAPEAVGKMGGIDFSVGNAATAVKIMGVTISIPQRLLLGVDEFWKTISDGGEILVQAKHAAHRRKSAGGTDQDAVDDAMMVMLDPNSLRKVLDDEARDITLTTSLRDQGKFIGAIGGLVNTMQRNPVGRMIFPFITAPTNDVLRTIERVPLAGALTPKAFADLRGMNGPVARQKAYAKQIVGTFALWQIYEQAMDGRITGGMPRDLEQRKLLPPNWKPYSLVFRAGFISPPRDKGETDEAYAARSSKLEAAYNEKYPEGWPVDEDGDELPLYDPQTGLPNGNLVYIPYAGMGPVSGMIAIAAGMVEHMRRTDDPEQQTDLISAGVAATFGYFENLPFLMGLSGVMKSIDYGDPGLLVDSPLGNMIPYTGVVPMPYSALNRNLSNAIDPTYYDANKEFDLRTADDVEAMGKDANGQYRYDLVGTGKGHIDSPSHMERMLDEWQQLMTVNSSVAGTLGIRDTEKFAKRYDVLGQEMERGVRFDVNPITAMYNLVSPLKLSYGEKMKPYQEELMKLGMPLVKKRTHISAGGKQIKLTNKQQADWVRIAKNEITLTRREAKFGSRRRLMSAHGRSFREALEDMTGNAAFRRLSLQDRINQIKNLEHRFFTKALPVLLDEPGNENLREVVEFRKNPKNEKLLGR